MKLLGSSRSPFVQKVRMALHEKGVPHEFIESSPASDEVTTANPLAKIPTLIRDNGRGLYDSSVIIEYVDGFGSGARLLPAEFEARIEVRRWEALGNGVMDATIAISHENRLPADQRKGAEFFAKQQRKIDSALAVMERDLGGREYCFGNSVSLADIACVAALQYLDRVMPDFKWRERHPNLSRHAAAVSARPSMKSMS